MSSHHMFLQVRIYNEGIEDAEITQHVGLVTVERPVSKAYGTLHFRMEDSIASTSLLNSGRLAGHKADRIGGTFVTVSDAGIINTSVI